MACRTNQYHRPKHRLAGTGPAALYEGSVDTPGLRRSIVTKDFKGFMTVPWAELLSSIGNVLAIRDQDIRAAGASPALRVTIS